MLKILKLLKNHKAEVFLVLCLLVVQAACDLELPGLMSDIVDIGLTRGGVPDASQEYIAQVAAGMGDSEVQMHYLWTTGGKMVAINLLGTSSPAGRRLRWAGTCAGRCLTRCCSSPIRKWTSSPPRP